MQSFPTPTFPPLAQRLLSKSQRHDTAQMHKFAVNLGATLLDNFKMSIIIETVPNQLVTTVKGMMGYRERSRKYKAEN